MEACMAKLRTTTVALRTPPPPLPRNLASRGRDGKTPGRDPGFCPIGALGAAQLGVGPADSLQIRVCSLAVYKAERQR